jgi:hypothetical protein
MNGQRRPSTRASLCASLVNAIVQKTRNALAAVVTAISIYAVPGATSGYPGDTGRLPHLPVALREVITPPARVLNSPYFIDTGLMALQ